MTAEGRHPGAGKPRAASGPVAGEQGGKFGAGGRGATAGPWHEFGPLPLSPLLEAALDAFTERGYHGASIRDIAQRAGVSLPTLYYHHGSKQGVLLALIGASMEELVARTGKALLAAGPAPADRFADFVDCVVRFVCHRPRFAHLGAEARYLDPDARVAYATPRNLVEQRLRSVIEDGARQGAFATEHPVDVTRALLGAYQSIATWYRPQGPLDAAEIAVRYVALSLDAVRALPDVREAAIQRARSR